MYVFIYLKQFIYATEMSKSSFNFTELIKKATNSSLFFN